MSTRPYLCVFVLVVILLAAQPHAVALAQTPNTSTIVVTTYLDQNDDGKYSPHDDSTHLSEGCQIWLFNDLSNRRLHDGAKLGDAELSDIDHQTPGDDGTVTFHVPPGRHSATATDNCFPSPGLRTIPGTYKGLASHDPRYNSYDYRPGCCPFEEGSPSLTVVSSDSGTGLLLIQTIEVQAGTTSTITLRGYPKHGDRSSVRLWYVVGGGTVVWVALIALGARLRRSRS